MVSHSDQPALLLSKPSLLNQNVEAPLFFSVPNTDTLFEPEAREKTVEILTSGEKSFNMQIFANVGHGFAVSLVPE